MKLNPILEAIFANSYRRVLTEALNNTDYTRFYRNHTATRPTNLFDNEAKNFVNGIIGLVLTPVNLYEPFRISTDLPNENSAPSNVRYNFRNGILKLKNFCVEMNNGLIELVTAVQDADHDIFEDDEFEEQIEDYCDGFMSKYKTMIKQLQDTLTLVPEYAHINPHVRFWGNMLPGQLKGAVMEVLKTVHTHPHKMHYQEIGKIGKWTAVEVNPGKAVDAALLKQYMAANSECEWIESMFTDYEDFKDNYDHLDCTLFFTGDKTESILFEHGIDTVGILDHSGNTLHEDEASNDGLYLNVARVMDDSDADLRKLISKAMIAYAPDLDHHTLFCDDALLERAMKHYLEKLQEVGAELLNDMELNDDGYRDYVADWAKKEGLVIKDDDDEDDDLAEIDWDAVWSHRDYPKYEDYNNDYRDGNRFLDIKNLSKGAFASAENFRKSYVDVCLEHGVDDAREVMVNNRFEYFATHALAEENHINLNSRYGDDIETRILKRGMEDISFIKFK